MDEEVNEALKRIRTDSQSTLAHIEEIKQSTQEIELLKSLEEIRANELENLRILEEIGDLPSGISSGLPDGRPE